MVPVRTNGKSVLTCRGCGFTSDKFSAEKYRITERVRRKHSDILVVEDGDKRKKGVDRRYLVDLYGNEMYDFDE